MRFPLHILQGLDVLVVDDCPGITSLVADILTGHGAEVVTANSGQRAMALVASTPFDLLILDLGMPQPDGTKVIEFMRIRFRDLLGHTLVLTGRTYDRRAMTAIANLGIPCLLKPFQIDQLVSQAMRISRNRVPAPAA